MNGVMQYKGEGRGGAGRQREGKWQKGEREEEEEEEEDRMERTLSERTLEQRWPMSDDEGERQESKPVTHTECEYDRRDRKALKVSNKLLLLQILKGHLR